MRICKTFEWEASHSLSLPYESKCQNNHGHTYKIEIEIEGEINENGMVIDFSKLKEWVNKANVCFDHCNINKDIPYFKNKNPTAENLIFFIYTKMNEIKNDFLGIPNYVKIRRIRIWETSKSFAEMVW